jgi:hypothetical protein
VDALTDPRHRRVARPPPIIRDPLKNWPDIRASRPVLDDLLDPPRRGLFETDHSEQSGELFAVPL